MKVKLQSRDGEPVAEIEIPLFKMLPGVIVWGERTFVHYGPDLSPSNPLTPVYMEVFAYTVPVV